jgi:ferritin-like metal-binding protein YciE
MTAMLVRHGGPPSRNVRQATSVPRRGARCLPARSVPDCPEPDFTPNVTRHACRNRWCAPQKSQHQTGSPAMGLFSQDIKTMDDLFVHTLKDIYYAENQIEKSLPDMIEKASSADLKKGLQAHLNETENHVARLEQVFKMHGVPIEGVDCPAIDGILEEADEIVGEVADAEVLDAAIIAAAQAVEHYEITRYGTLIAWAHQLGRDDCAAVLQKNLEEEKAADKKLTQLAETGAHMGNPARARRPFTCAPRAPSIRRSERRGPYASPGSSCARHPCRYASRS